jgi:alkylhydroperoxidase family enzyme
MTVPERVPPLPPEERDERQADLVRKAGAEYGVYTTLVRHADLFADFLPYGRRLLRLSSLPPYDRETLILRTAFRCGARYEWAHHDVIGRGVGLTDEDIAALGRPGIGPDVPAATARLIRAADELVTNHRLSDATWDELTAAYTQNQVIELCMLVGEYAMLAGALNSLGVRIEDGFPAPPWDPA